MAHAIKTFKIAFVNGKDALNARYLFKKLKDVII
jgi:hypothetical protein